MFTVGTTVPTAACMFTVGTTVLLWLPLLLHVHGGDHRATYYGLPFDLQLTSQPRDGQVPVPRSGWSVFVVRALSQASTTLQATGKQTNHDDSSRSGLWYCNNTIESAKEQFVVACGSSKVSNLNEKRS